MTPFDAVLLSIIEGLTEFLPVSSTGHLILTSAFLHINEDPFVKSFNIIIQMGAIASVLVLYWRRFLPNFNFYKKLFIAFLPAAVIGLLVKDQIDVILGSVQIVAWALMIGGVLLIWSDKKFPHPEQGRKIEETSTLTFLKLGLIQCFAFIPGVSRSASTILGGLYLGMSKKEAAEFSFFLAVPTLAGASVVKGAKLVHTIQADQIGLLLIGLLISFVVAMIAIKFFISLLTRFGFKHFGWYRIILGAVILICYWRGIL